MNIFKLSILLLFSSTSIFAQFENIQISSEDAYYPEEVTIAINPNNPEQMAAGANLNYFFSQSTTDKGWIQKQMTSDLGVWGDPCVIYDNQNNLYFAHLSNPVSGYWIDRIVVQKSTDNGKSWNNGVGVGFNEPKNQDKEWLAADHTNSQFKNNIYMAWTEFDSYGSDRAKDKSRILFAYSEDSGETWGEPVKVSDTEGDCVDEDDTVEGAVPAVGPNGEVYLSWAGPLGLMFDKSLDGGKTFGTDIFVSDIPGGWDFNVSGISRCNGLPITACDISKSEHRGNIYIGWSDQRNGTNNTDIFFKKSTDKGETWSELIKVNSDTTKRHQFFTWMTVDSTSGNIYFVFYDRRNTDYDETEVYIARSVDGGESFQNYKISESSFVPNSGVFFGDYINIAVFKGEIKPIWMRMDKNKLSIWTANISDADLDATSVKSPILEITDFNLLQNYPNPFNPSTTIKYSIPYVENAKFASSTHVSIKVYDILGRDVATLVDKYQNSGDYEVKFNGINSLPSGIYFYNMVTPNFTKSKKMILLR